MPTFLDITSELTKEPRKFSRVPLQAQAKIALDHHVVDGEVENIGLGGVFVKAKEAIPVGSIVTITISTPQTSNVISALKAKVVRVLGDGIGLQFLPAHP